MSDNSFIGNFKNILWIAWLTWVYLSHLITLVLPILSYNNYSWLACLSQFDRFMLKWIPFISPSPGHDLLIKSESFLLIKSESLRTCLYKIPSANSGREDTGLLFIELLRASNHQEHAFRHSVKPAIKFALKIYFMY